MLSTYGFTFCRWLIAITFAVSAAGKARSMTSFRAAVTDLGVLPARLVSRAATLAVAAETVVVLLMAVGGVAVPIGFVLALALLAAFSVALSRALRRQMRVSCNCFGPGERQISWYDVLRNAVLAAFCVAGCWLSAVNDGGPQRIGLILVAGLMAATLLVVVTNLEDIVEILRKPYVVD